MPLADPHPLPAYDFDDALSDDENFLTWAVVYARWSASRRGHMAALIVKGDGDGGAGASVPSSSRAAPLDRILSHANNQPAIYLPPSSKAKSRQQHDGPQQAQGADPAPTRPATENFKAVPEVHAEAFAISLAARRGIPIDGATIYVTYPPCAECSRLILACGIRRCVFRKTMYRKLHPGFLAAAEVAGVELKGTGLAYDFLRAEQGELDPERLETEQLKALLAQEGALESAREARARKVWEAQGETTEVTRARVDAFWSQWLEKHREAHGRLEDVWRTWEEDIEPRITAAGRRDSGKQGSKVEKKPQSRSEEAQSPPRPVGAQEQEAQVAPSSNKKPRMESQSH